MFSNVCLVLNVDGFHLHGKFQAKELAFVSLQNAFPPESVHFKVGNPRTRQETSHVAFVFQNIHGLPLYGGDMPQNMLPRYLSHLYELHRTSSRTHVAIKGNNQLQGVLKKLGIPFIDVEKNGCPNYEPPSTPDFTCHRHSLGRRCARSMVAFYKEWMLE